MSLRSLIPSYVLATDNLFYKNPVLEGRAWFVGFSFNGHAELVIRESLYKKGIAFSSFLKTLEKKHLFLKVNNGHMKCRRRFGNAVSLAVSWQIEVVKPIPVDLIRKPCESVQYPDDDDCVIFSCGNVDFCLAKRRQYSTAAIIENARKDFGEARLASVEKGIVKKLAWFDKYADFLLQMCENTRSETVRIK